MKMKGLISKFLDVLFPNNIKCVVCKRDLKENNDFCICEKCLKRNKICLDGKVCEKCGGIIKDMGEYCLNCKRIPHSFDLARAYFEYGASIQKLIKAFKFEGDKYLKTFFGECLLKVYKNYGIAADVVTAVPIHGEVLKKRGFNQSELIAEDFAGKIGIETDFVSLVKTKPTPMQVGLNFKERMKNLEGSFKVIDKDAFKDKTVILVDDVLTTGATADECSAVLRKAGAKKIIVLTVANVNKQIYAKEKGNDSSE